MVRNLVAISKALKIPAGKDCKGRKVGRNQREKLENSTQIGLSLFHRQKATLPIYICRRHQNWWTNFPDVEASGDPVGRTKFHNPRTQARRIQAWHPVSGCTSLRFHKEFASCRMPRRGQHASSSSVRNESRNPNVQASGDWLQSEDDDLTNLLFLGVFHIW